MGGNYEVVSGQPGKREVRVVKEGLAVTGWPRPDRSQDEKRGWAGFGFNGQTLPLPSGDYLATLYGKFQGADIPVHVWGLVLAESRDGLNWKIRSIIVDEKTCKAFNSASESAIARLKDGRLMCVFRVASGVPYGQTFSSDEGRTWTEPITMAGVFSVRPCLTVMADGMVALSGGRPGLFLWLNLDGTGKDWQQIDILAIHNAACSNEQITSISEPLRQTTSYIKVVPLDDSHLLLIYDRVPYGWKAIPSESTETNSIWAMQVTLAKSRP
jgi:hypothetical protein